MKAGEGLLKCGFCRVSFIFSATINGGGGVEVRLADAWTLRLEGLVHVLTGEDPSRLATASLGFKYYF